eukprot:jgi/Mesvir1/26843/Mv20596-RA.1
MLTLRIALWLALCCSIAWARRILELPEISWTIESSRCLTREQLSEYVRQASVKGVERVVRAAACSPSDDVAWVVKDVVAGSFVAHSSVDHGNAALISTHLLSDLQTRRAAGSVIGRCECALPDNTLVSFPSVGIPCFSTSDLRAAFGKGLSAGDAGRVMPLTPCASTSAIRSLIVEIMGQLNENTWSMLANTVASLAAELDFRVWHAMETGNGATLAGELSCASTTALWGLFRLLIRPLNPSENRMHSGEPMEYAQEKDRMASVTSDGMRFAGTSQDPMAYLFHGGSPQLIPCITPEELNGAVQRGDLSSVSTHVACAPLSAIGFSLQKLQLMRARASQQPQPQLGAGADASNVDAIQTVLENEKAARFAARSIIGLCKCVLPGATAATMPLPDRIHALRHAGAVGPLALAGNNHNNNQQTFTITTVLPKVVAPEGEARDGDDSSPVVIPSTVSQRARCVLYDELRGIVDASDTPALQMNLPCIPTQDLGTVMREVLPRVESAPALSVLAHLMSLELKSRKGGEMGACECKVVRPAGGGVLLG